MSQAAKPPPLRGHKCKGAKVYIRVVTKAMRLEIFRAKHATEPQALWDARRHFIAAGLAAGFLVEHLEAKWELALALALS